MNLSICVDDASLVQCPVGMKDVWMTLMGDKKAQSLSNPKTNEKDSCTKYVYDILKSLR